MPSLFSPKLLSIAAVCLLCSNAFGQEALSVIDSLRVPGAPAFKIIGTEPTAVERPTDLKALAMDLSSLATSNANPTQFALEFGLVKLFSAGTKGLIEYYYPSIPSTMLDNLSLSLATASIPADMFVDTSFHSSAAWSFGLRTHLLSGSYDMSKDDFTQALRQRIMLTDNVDRFLKYVLRDILTDTAKLKILNAQISAGGFASTTPTADIALLVDAAFEQVVATIPALVAQVQLTDLPTIKSGVTRYFLLFIRDQSPAGSAITAASAGSILAGYDTWSTGNILNSPAAVYNAKQLATMLATKSGSYLELAFAGAGVGRNDKVDEFTLRRYGVWVTYAYRPSSTDSWEGSAMLRMISNETESSSTTQTYDLGCRASSPRIWPAALSFEAVARISPMAKPDFRIAVIGEYPLMENFYLTATFGRGFDIENPNGGNLLSVLGIKFGLGANKLLLTDKDLQ